MFLISFEDIQCAPRGFPKDIKDILESIANNTKLNINYIPQVILFESEESMRSWDLARKPACEVDAARQAVALMLKRNDLLLLQYQILGDYISKKSKHILKRCVDTSQRALKGERAFIGTDQLELQMATTIWKVF